MNNARRKALSGAIDLIEKLKGQVDEIRSVVSSAYDEEQEYYDNMPESMQSGEKGEAASAAADALQEACNTLDELDLDDLISKIEEARA